MSMRYKKNSIGQDLRRLRKERSWSLDQVTTELAKIGCFVSEKTLARIESRTAPVGEKEIQAFAEVFRMRVEYFLED